MSSSSSSSYRIYITHITEKKNKGATVKIKNKKITIKPNNWAKIDKLA